MTRLAAVDCGTNSIRLLICDSTDGKIKEIHRTMEIVRLGEGVDETGHFSDAALARTANALEGYATIMDIERVWPTLDAVEGHPVGVLLTGVLMHTRFYSESREVFEGQGVATFYNAVPQREEIKAAFGTTPTRLHGYDDVYREIIDIEEL